MLEWAGAHLGEAVALLAVAIPTLIQVSPIKVEPWSALVRWLGRTINGELLREISGIRESLDAHIEQDDNRFAKQCRLRILRFNDETLQGVPHTKEHYDEILDDVTAYERHCELHPGYRNSKASMAIQNVEAKYQEHLRKKDFLWGG